MLSLNRLTQARALLLAVLLLSSITLLVFADNFVLVIAQTPTSLVLDNFDGTAIDTEKWTIEQGPKESSGSITVTNSYISLTSNDGSFPRLVSAVNPFPLTGDFAVEFDITYTRITEWGTGIWLSQGAFVPSKDRINANIMQIWGTTTDGLTISLLGDRTVYQDDLYTHPTPWGYWNTSSMVFRLQYSKGVYTLFMNSAEVASGKSDLRPDVFGFGIPIFPGFPGGSPRLWSNFKTDCIRILPSADLALSCSPLSSNLGFKVDINGALTDKIESLHEAKILLSYLIPDTTTWIPITSTTTDALGFYAATWYPTATGTYLLKAEWKGDETHGGTYEAKNVSVSRGTGEALFLAESNSTLSSLAFNSELNEISFSASGPSGTTGYVRFVISSTLMEDVTNFRVYLDGQQLQFTATSETNTHILYFQYSHSSHNILIKMLTAAAPLLPDLKELPSTALPLLIGGIVIAIVTVLIGVTIRKRRDKAHKTIPK
jgi:hypothetical protein